MNVVGSVRRELSALWDEDRGKILLPVAIGWGFLVGARVVYPVVLPYLRTTFDLSFVTAGLLVTVLWLGSAVGQLPSGILADRYDERLILAASPLVVAIALAFVVTAPSATMLFAATAMVGVGGSIYPVARITVLSDVYPDRIGSALGVTMAVGDLGQTILPPVASTLAVVTAWQFGIGFLIVPLLGVTVWLWLRVPSRPGTESAVDTLSADNVRYLVDVLTQPSLLFMTLVLFLYVFVWQSFSSFYPTYLIDEKGLSVTNAGLLYGLFFGTGVVVKPLAGAAYDRFGIRRTLTALLVLPVGALLMLPMVDGFWTLAVVTAPVSGMLGTGAITQSYLSDAFPPDMQGTGLGIVRSSVSTVGAMGPVVFGTLAGSGYFDEGYLLLAVIMLAVVLLTSQMPVKDV